MPEGPLALVTGGAHRIGKAIVQELALRGNNVIIHYYQSKDLAIELCNNLTQKFPTQHFSTIQANLACLHETKNLLTYITQNFGRCDVVINNAATFIDDHLDSFDSKIMIEQLTLNLLSPLMISNQLVTLKYFSQRNIINILDQRVLLKSKNYFSYTLSKQMLADITKKMALNFAPHTRVNGIALGLALPNLSDSKERIAKVSAQSPLGCENSEKTIENIQKTISFIIANSSLTGNTIFVDQGMHLQS